MESNANVRVDSWIWAVRLAKTRSTAKTACVGGHVRVNGTRVKASQTVSVGDEVRVRLGQRERVVIVAGLIKKRVGAAVAAENLIDRTPPPPPRVEVAAPPRRERGAGRPTKRERRQIDRLRGR